MKIEITEQEDIVQTKKIVVGTQVTEEIYNILKEESDEAFMSISGLLRKLIYKHLRELERENSAKLNERN